MYGDLDDYVSDNQSPQVKQLIKINQNLSRQVELLEAQVNETAQVKEETKKSNVKLEALPGINDDSA